MDRAPLLDALERLAPLGLAESWDNVGLIVDPVGAARFEKAFLTIDLTHETFREAAEGGADLVIAYHPPIFRGLKRVRAHQPGEDLVVMALRAGITIYSPHTALDAARDGMTEWLGQALGPGRMWPLVPQPDDPEVGAGRLVALESPLPLSSAVDAIKRHLRLQHVRLASPTPDLVVRRLAVCPGAGGSVLEKIDDVDLLLTGEMRHHDILARRARGTAVIVTDHTNSERAYLPEWAERMRASCPGLSIQVSSLDADPLQVV